MTPPESRELLWDRSQEKWLQESHLGCSFGENWSVFYRRKSQTAIGEHMQTSRHFRTTGRVSLVQLPPPLGIESCFFLFLIFPGSQPS